MSDEGRVLAGRYRVGALIGRGGMSDVHVGTDTRLGRRVAIKLLKPQLATDPAFRMRFRQEAQSAARMAHPTIVRVFDAGEETVVDSAGHEVQLPFIAHPAAPSSSRPTFASIPLDAHCLMSTVSAGENGESSLSLIHI